MKLPPLDAKEKSLIRNFFFSVVAATILGAIAWLLFSA